MVKKYNAILFVESPNKIKIYQNSLKNEDYQIKVLTTKGHLREVIIEKFNTHKDEIYLKWKEKIHISNIIKQLKLINFNQEQDLFIATDADREGEAIGWHLTEILKKHFNYTKPAYRVYCIELNQKSIINEVTNAKNNYNQLSQYLINAYKARVTIDLILGINGSCLLWEKLYGCKSLGRVQSVSILKIFELEEQIRNFIKEKYYKLNIQINENLNLKIHKITKENKEIKEITNIEEIEKLKKEIEQQVFKFNKLNITKKASHSIYPLDMSALSSIANSKLNMKIKEMYSVCQKLYEGIKYKDEIIGTITYMRTDSQYISDSFKYKIKEHIEKIFTQDSFKFLVQKKDTKVIIQEAHEAIRPTFLMNQKDYQIFIEHLNRKEQKIYKYILFRTLASFMQSPIYENTEYILNSENNKYTISLAFKEIVSLGYTKLLEYYDCHFCYTQIKSENQKEEIEKILNQTITCKATIQEHNTHPPERFTESKLIQELKKNNIGRPSTYSYIVETIKTREYVKMENNQYYITSLGCLLCIFIIQHLNMFINYNFTSEMEVKLDEIAQGKLTIQNVIKIFLEQFNKNINPITLTQRIDIIINIEKYILTKYIQRCITCNKILCLKFFKQKPYVCCSCGYIEQINKIGYKDKENIPKINYYSKSQQYIKKIVNKNYKNYKNYKNKISFKKK